MDNNTAEFYALKMRILLCIPLEIKKKLPSKLTLWFFLLLLIGRMHQHFSRKQFVYKEANGAANALAKSASACTFGRSHLSVSMHFVLDERPQ